MKKTYDHPKLGLPEMDAQHEWLFALFDKIEPTAGTGRTEAMRKLLREIEGYLLFHFASEEHLMRHYAFPGFDLHQTDHEAAGAKLVRFLDDFDAGRLQPAALRIFLSGWLAEHAAAGDTRYAAWIKDRRKDLAGQ